MLLLFAEIAGDGRKAARPLKNRSVLELHFAIRASAARLLGVVQEADYSGMMG